MGAKEVDAEFLLAGGVVQVVHLGDELSVVVVILNEQVVGAALVGAFEHFDGIGCEHVSVFGESGLLELGIGVDQHALAAVALAGADVVFGPALLADFKAEAIAAGGEFVGVRVNRAASALAPVVFQNVTRFIDDAPEIVKEATLWAGHLHRDRFGIGFSFTHFRAENTVAHAGVIQDKAVLFIGIEAETTADDLLIEAD